MASPADSAKRNTVHTFGGRVALFRCQVNKPFQAASRPNGERERNFPETRSRAQWKISGRNTVERRCSRLARESRGTPGALPRKAIHPSSLNGWTFKTPLRVPRKETNPAGVPPDHFRRAIWRVIEGLIAACRSPQLHAQHSIAISRTRDFNAEKLKHSFAPRLFVSGVEPCPYQRRSAMREIVD